MLIKIAIAQDRNLAHARSRKIAILRAPIAMAPRPGRPHPGGTPQPCRPVPRRAALAAAWPPRLGRGRSGPRPFLPARRVRALEAGFFLIACDGGRVGGPRPLFPKAMHEPDRRSAAGRRRWEQAAGQEADEGLEGLGRGEASSGIPFCWDGGALVSRAGAGSPPPPPTHPRAKADRQAVDTVDDVRSHQHVEVPAC